MKIAGREIGTHVPPFVIAELGAGHDNTLEGLTNLLEACLRAEVDAAKIQVYQADDIMLPGVGEALKAGPWHGMDLYSIYQQGALDESLIPELFRRAATMKLPLFASIFHPRVIPVLEEVGCPAYKIASLEINYQELIMKAAATAKPVLISTGLASIDEIHNAWFAADCDNAALLHCVAAYPCPVGEANLHRIIELKRRFLADHIGFSDHTQGKSVAVAAVALGATIVEKHLATAGTLDSAFGLRPYEFADFTQAVRDAWDALSPEKEERAEKLYAPLRRSIWAVADIAEGEKFTDDNIKVLRPAGGISPTQYSFVLGERATRAIKRGEPIVESDVEEFIAYD